MNFLFSLIGQTAIYIERERETDRQTDSDRDGDRQRKREGEREISKNKVIQSEELNMKESRCYDVSVLIHHHQDNEKM